MSHRASRGELAFMFVVLGGLMFVFRAVWADDPVAEAAIFSTIYATVFVVMWAWAERRRRATRSSALDATEVEPGVVTATERGTVTVRGERHEVTWRPDSTLGLRAGQQVWAAPRIAPGEWIVLVRAARSFGLTQDVVGSRSDAVEAAARPDGHAGAPGRRRR
ncbi:hypothetical protein BJF80_13230 [Serinicoccus sp. CUA-874]|uniref:hypothetical protein n=1 Tax=unclassified Serinicoccus TaxID=2643101 RepID=UPI000969B243|nr:MULTISPECIES: hypothetical protein [unclassified Serinicoccus]OLT19012.1 hypothetical protein BJF80_13230 [Serinicoccus sp. CUA-874]